MQGTEGLVCSYRVCSFSQGINGQCSATLVQLFLLVYSWYCDGLQDVLIALVVAAADYTVMCLQSEYLSTTAVEDQLHCDGRLPTKSGDDG